MGYPSSTLTYKSIFVIIFLACITVAFCSDPNSWYVSVDGDNSNDGRSWINSFQTIQTAIDTASDNDTVWVAEGTYYEKINFLGKEIIVQSTDPNDWDVVSNTVIDGNDLSGATVLFESNDTSDTVLSGFTVRSSDAKIRVDGISHYSWGFSCPTIKNCILEGAGRTGIDVVDGSPTIQNNIIRNITGWGMYIRCHGEPHIENNWIYNTSDGIKFVNGTQGEVYNNTIVNNKTGISTYTGVPDIKNCILWDNLYYDLGSGCTASYSCIEGGDSGVGNISAQPNFVDATNGDFHLLPGSPCIDAGDPNGVYTGQTDIDGDSRVMGTYVDTGADEFLQVSIPVDPNSSIVVYYVSMSGNDNNDGLSWESAFATIQKGIDSSSNGDSVIISEGTYLETIDFKGKAITVRSMEPNDPTVVAATIIDANDIGAAVVTFDSDETTVSILEGVTVTGGLYGIVIDGCTPTIRRCVINDNSSWGIYCDSSSSDINDFMEISGCTIRDNGSYGFYGYGNITLSSCLISDNGSCGVYISDEWGTFDVINCTVVNNSKIGTLASDDGLVGYWTLDEGSAGVAYDAQGSNDGTLTGMDTNSCWISGVSGAALEFDGDDDYIACGHSAALSPEGQLTISAWVNIADTNDNVDMVIVSKKTSWNSSSGYGIDYNPSNDRLYMTGSGSDYAYSNNLSLEGGWHHITVVANGSVGKLYIDGVDETDDSSISPITSYTTPLYIGRYYAVGDGVCFNGSIDDFRLYDYALSAQEVQALYLNTGRGLENCTDSISNSIIWGNGMDQLIGCFVPSYCDIQDWTGGGTGNISADPNFVNEMTGDYHLSVSSPCIDAGDPNGLYAGQFDIDGDSRVMGSNVDMGADEVSRVWYVDGSVASSGDGRMWQTAFKYLDEALSAASVNEEVWVAAGEYYRGISGLTGYWQFDDGSGSTAVDAEGNNDGTLTNMDPATDWVDGLFDKALDFDGGGEYVSLPDNAVTTTEFTISAWANISGQGGGGSGRNVIFTQRSDTGGDGYCNVVLFADDLSDPDNMNKARAIVKSSFGTELLLYSGIEVADNEWHHYALSLSTTECVLYVDGVAADTVAITEENAQDGDYVTNIDYVDIARYRYSGTDSAFFNGKIDGIRVYNRALSSQETSDIAEKPKVFFDIPAGLKIYGGFDTFEISKEQRNPITNRTILSGNGEMIGDDSGNSDYVVRLNAESLLDGFTVQDGIIGIGCDANVPCTIQNCVIQNNTDGIVVYSDATAIIEKNEIRDNLNSGIFSVMGQPLVHNNLIYDNGTGISYLGYTSQPLANNTIVNNVCYGIISLGCQTPTISNSILYNNGDDLANCDATYSCLQDGDSGEGNVYSHPHFVYPDNRDYRLKSYSPCIDAGDPNDAYRNEPDYPFGQINMGAYGNTAGAALASADTDSDGLPDDWEIEYLGDLTPGANDDSEDSDGLTNLEEYVNGTDPANEDTDGDGMSDGWEVDHGLDPLDAADADQDPDGDDKTNYEEFLADSNPTASDIIYVPTDYATIQAAIDACEHDGDIVEIDPNTYAGPGNINLDFGGKKIIVRGSGSGEVVVDCEGTGRAFYFHSGEEVDSAVSDLTIINGNTFYGGAVLCMNSSPTFERCVFKENQSACGGAVYNEQGTPNFVNCIFIDNETVYGNGGAIYNSSLSSLSGNDPNLPAPAIPVGHWTMDDGSGTTAVDMIGDNNGTLMGSSPNWLNGIFDGALDFNGTDDYIRIPHDSSLNIHGAGAQLTVCGWFNYKSTGTPREGFIGKSVGADYQYKLSRRETTGNIVFEVWDDGTGLSRASYQNPTVSEGWNFIVGTFDGQQTHVYLNGVAGGYSNNALINGIKDASGDIAIGVRYDATPEGQLVDYPFEGVVDDVRIYDKALSLQEIQTLYESAPYTLAAHWKLNDYSGTTAVDAIGDNDGTLTNMDSSADWVRGVLGGALDFDGSNDHIAINSPTDLPTGSNVTVTAWIKPNSLQADLTFNGIVSYGPRTGDVGASLTMAIKSDGHPSLATWGSNNFTPTSGPVVDWDQWNFIAAVIEGTSVTLYVNDESISGTLPNIPAIQSGDLYMGCTGNWDGPGRYFAGAIDDVRLYYEALSEQEIQEVYETPHSPLVGHWKLDDGNGTTAVDTIGNNNGTLMGSSPNWLNGIFDGALDFNGTDDYIRIPHDSSLNIHGVGAQLTVCGWFNFTSAGTPREGFIGKSVGADYQYKLSRRETTGNIVFEVWDDGTGLSRASYQNPTVSEGWNFIVGTFDGQQAHVYLNGVAGGYSNNALINGIKDASGDIAIGVRYDATPEGQLVDYPFEGVVDDVRIYDKALSLQEIQTLYGNTSYSLVAHWELDNVATAGTASVVDSSDYANDGTPVNDMNSAEGVFGNALAFNGTSDYIDCGNAAVLSPVDKLSISTWVKIADPNLNSYMRIVSKKTTWDGVDGYELEYNPYLNQLTFMGAGSEAGRATSLDLDTNWHHIAVIANGTHVTLYIDGVDQTTDSIIDSVVANNTSLQIGRQSGGSDYFEGFIDELRLYDRVLLSREVQELYDSRNVTRDSITLTNCTLKDNVASGYGGGIFNESDCEPSVNNCILWANADCVGSYGISQITGGQPDISNSCVQSRPADTLGNINDNPRFIIDTLGYGVYTLKRQYYYYGLGGYEDLIHAGAVVETDTSLEYWSDEGEWLPSNSIVQSGKLVVAGEKTQGGADPRAAFTVRYRVAKDRKVRIKSYTWGNTSASSKIARTDTYQRASDTSILINDTAQTISEGATYVLASANWNPGDHGSGTSYLKVYNLHPEYFDVELYVYEYDEEYDSAYIKLESWIEEVTASESYPDYYHYTLYHDSPCIDAGSNLFVWDRIVQDFSGNGRIFDGDNDGQAVVDMGACEFEKHDWTNNTPVLESIDDKTVAEGSKLRFIFNATDSDNDVIWYSAENLPFGATYDGNIFLWTPEEGQAGTYNVTLIASDGKLQDSETIQINVVEQQLAAYWNFDDGSGLTADDATGNHDGTLVNMEESDWKVRDVAFTYWPLDNGSGTTAFDKIRDNHGTLTGMDPATDWISGVKGAALDFDGSDDYISVPHNSDLDFSGTSFTLSAWVQVSDDETWRPIINKRKLGNWDGFFLRINTDLSVEAGSGSSASEHKAAVTYADSVTPGAWAHIAAVFDVDDTTAIPIYINGVPQPLEAATSGGTDYDDSGIEMYIGRDHNESNRHYFAGQLDEVSIYNHAFSEQEIRSLYEMTPDATDEGALKFGGNTEYITLQNMNSAYYSISFWANFGDAQSDERIVDFGGNFYISRYGTDSQMAYKNGSATEYSDSGYIVNNKWHYYTVVHVVDGSDKYVVFYRDGVQYGNIQVCSYTPTAYTGAYSYIGTNGSASGNYFEGYLDELRIYERSLSEDEVEQLYENQNDPVLTSIGSQTVEIDNLLTFSLSATDSDDGELTYSTLNLPAGARFNGRVFSWIPADGQQGNHVVTFIANDRLFEDSEEVTISVVNSTGTPEGTAKAVSGELGNDLSLSVDPFTGSVSYSLPIVVPPARQGTEPSLVLQYSGAGNGWCGFGWSLGMGTIQRDTQNGLPVKRNAGEAYQMAYDNNKGFTVSFASVNSRLTYIDTDAAGIQEYRAEIDQAFLKYELDPTNNEWIVTDKSGNQFYFGEFTGEDTETVGVRMDNPKFTSATNGEQTFLWGLAKIVDMNGNTTYLDYVQDGNQIYLESVRYNGNLGDPANNVDPISATHTIEFVLEDRPDTSFSYATGCKVASNKRLSEILVKIYGTQEELVRRYKLNYRVSPSSRRSLLHDVVMFGADNVSSLPPVTFEYQEYDFEFGPAQDWGPLDNQGFDLDNADGRTWNSPSGTQDQDTFVELLDINSDGLPDRVMRSRQIPYNVFKVQLNTGNGFQTDSGGNFITQTWGPIDTQGNDESTNWGSIQGINENDYDVRTMLFDINGDGFADRVMTNDVEDFSNGENVFKVQLNNGLGFDSELVEWTNVDNQGGTANTNWNSMLGSYTSSNDKGTLTMMSDFNGDGLPDRIMRERNTDISGDTSEYDVFRVQFNTGSGFENSIDWGPIKNGSDAILACPNASSSSDSTVSLLDINGDGLTDRVMRDYTSPYDCFRIQFNIGYGFEAYEDGTPIVRKWEPLYSLDGNTNTELASMQGIDDNGDATVMLFDISADGLPDRILRNSVSDFSEPENVFKVQLNTGTGFEAQARLWKGIDNQGEETSTNWNSPYGTDADGTVAMLMDINGDGLPDRVMRKTSDDGYGVGNNVFRVQLNRGPIPDMLKRVNNAMGGQVEVAYTPSTQFDNTDNDGRSKLAFPVQTATSITLRDGMGTESTTTYDYSRGYYDIDRREFRGFGRVEITAPYGEKSVTYYHQGGGFDDSANGEFEDDGAFAKKGMPYLSETYGSDGRLYSRAINKVVQEQVQTGKDWYFAYTAQTVTMEYEGMQTYRAKAQSATYDVANGRIETSTSYGEVENVDIENHTFDDVVEYSDGRDDYTYITTTEFYEFANYPEVLNKVERTWVSTSGVYDANRLAETVYTYDPNTAATLTESKWVEDTTYLTKTYEYDAYGNQNRVENEVGITTTVTYDTEFRMFAVTKSTGATNPFVTESTTDPRSGLPIISKNAMGIQSQQIYDPFFRLTDSYIGTEPNASPLAGVWLTHIDYNVGGIEDGSISHNFIRQRHSGYEAYIYNDGLGRVIQGRVKAEDGAEGQFRVSESAYDARGKVYFTCDAFFDDGADFSEWDPTRPGVLTEFDATSRPYKITSTHDDGYDSPMAPAFTEYSDNGDPWTQKAIDPMGKVIKKTFDARGRVIKLIEVTDDGDIVTNYYYDIEGRLTDSVDSQGNTTSAEYDAIGQKIRSADPDSGVWTYAYDDDGKLSEQTDARGNTVMLYYNDPLRRLTKKEVYDNSDPQVLVREVTYTYDSGETGYTVHKGQLFKVEEKVWNASTQQMEVLTWTKTGYDSRGRAVKATRYLAETDDEYTTETTYDDADRITTSVYPNNEATLAYDYGTAGELTAVRSTAGTGENETFYAPQGFDADGRAIGVEYGNGVATEFDYYTYSKRLRRVHTYQTATRHELFDLVYTFDEASNITNIYDEVYSGSASGTMTDIRYDDLYRLQSMYSVGKGTTVSYDYDETGNILKNGDYGTGEYVYGGQNRICENGYQYDQPHAVTSANGKNYGYDAGGNMVARGSQTLTYDAQNNLVRVADPNAGLDVSYVYTAAGTRLYKINNNNGLVTQLWIGSIYEEKYDAGRNRTLTLCHVHAGGSLVASFEPQSTWAGIVNNNRTLAKAFDLGNKGFGALFRGGRTPLTVPAMFALVGLAMGIYYNRRRLWQQFRIFGAGPRDWLILRNPAREMLLMLLVGAMLICSFPYEAYADGPTTDPVFYYYQSDHLGSASVMTNREGEVVQHYGYTAFGNERYKNNNLAFGVTNRYTGQQIDEETGLYFYQSRYYDAELGRFTQADTIVPSADTSQALNRYTYVKNNPLKFTDPSGHGWFSKIWKKVKGWIGTIVTIGLFIAAPWGSGFWATFAYSTIGSAVGTVVNGGSFKSFAIGVGVGIAAGAIVSGVGSFLNGNGFTAGVKNFFSEASKDALGQLAKWGSQSIGHEVAAGAINSVVNAAVNSAVYGGNLGKNMLEVAKSGALGAAFRIVQGKIDKGLNLLKSMALSKFRGILPNIRDAIAPFVNPVLKLFKKDLQYYYEKLDQKLAEKIWELWKSGGGRMLAVPGLSESANPSIEGRGIYFTFGGKASLGLIKKLSFGLHDGEFKKHWDFCTPSNTAGAHYYAPQVLPLGGMVYGNSKVNFELKVNVPKKLR